MKTYDNQFRGFPALWNAAAFYLFLLKPPAAIGSILLAVLVILTFVPFNVLHPVRTTRLRKLNLALIVVWAILAIVTVVENFVVPWWVTAALCAIGVYILFIDTVIRIIGWNRA